MRRTLVAAPLLALVLTGCGGNPEPQPLPRPTAKPSPTQTASAATPPQMPEAAKAKTKAGASEFVRYYVALLNYAFFTGDTGPAKGVAKKSCQSCNDVVRSIAAIYAEGGSVQGGTWSPEIVSDARFPDGSGWTVDARISYGPQEITRKVGGEPERFTGGSRLTSFVLRTRPSGGWVVEEWTRAS